MVLEDERAQDVMVDLEWDAQPMKRRLAGELDFAASLHLLGYLRSAEQGFAGAQYVFDEAGGEFCGRRSGSCSSTK